MSPETEDMCEEGETPGLPDGSTPLATPVTSPGRRFDGRENLDPGESVDEPRLDARVLSVQRDSAGTAVVELGQLSWAGWPVSGRRTLLSCYKFMSELHGILWFTIQALGIPVDYYPQTLPCKSTLFYGGSVTLIL